MYKIKVINSMDTIHSFSADKFAEFIEKLAQLNKANRSFDVFVNGKMVATAEGGQLHQFAPIKKI